MGENTATSATRTIESASAPSIAVARETGKQFKRSAKSDKETADIKYKDNRKQFEVNLRLDNILAGSPADIHKLVAEAELIIKKRQKLIKIADKNKDGWLVVQEYETDDLASDAEDEKNIRKAKAAAEKKRRVTLVTLRENLSLVVIFSFFAVRPLFIFTL